MLDFLPEWYRMASIEPDVEILNKRREGINNHVSAMDKQSVFEIVRLFFKKGLKYNESIDSFRSAFRDVDEIFPLRNNNLELQILAGASILNCIESNHKHSINAALATLCANFQNADTMSIVDEVRNASAKYLDEQSIKSRKRDNLPQINLELIPDALKTNLRNSFSYETVQPIIEMLEKSLKQSIKTTKKSLTIFEKSLMAQEEEADILWWLLGEHSNDLKCSISKLKRSASTIIIAKELADKTRIIPGPISIDAFIDKSIQKSKKQKNTSITLKEAINDTPLDWRSNLISEKDFDEVEDLCPIHFAIKRSVESGDKSSWIVSFEKNIGIKADASISPLELSLQAYREFLLIENIQ